MIRAGLIRQLTAGVYTYMPFMWRVLRKVSQIVREEMDAAGAIEMLMPLITPRELWNRTGRYDDYMSSNTLMHFTGRGGIEYVLPPTHEEIVTALVANELSLAHFPQLYEGIVPIPFFSKEG